MTKPSQLILLDDKGVVVTAKTDVAFTLNNMHMAMIEYGAKYGWITPIKEDKQDAHPDSGLRN